MVLVLGIAAVLLLTTFSVNNWLNRDQLIKEKYVNNSTAAYLAEAGIEQLLWYLSEDYYWGEPSVGNVINDKSSFTANIVSLDYVAPLPQGVDEPAGMIIVEISSIGINQASKERINATVEITYDYHGQAAFRTITWERHPP